MFESITFRAQNKTDVNNPLDIGMLLECMLFYRTTNIIADQSILKQLLREFGTDQVDALIEEQLLRIIYTESMTGIKTNTSNGVQFHDPVIFFSPQHTFQDVIRRQCIELTGREGKGKRIARRLENKITAIQHDTLITDGAKRSLLDQTYLKTSIQIVLRTLIPSIGSMEGFNFSTEKTDKGIVVHTNINFDALNVLYHQIVPASHSSLSSAFLLANIFDVESDLYFSSTYLSELVTSALGARLMMEKFNYLARTASKSRDNIEHFQDFIFGDARALREAVNKKNVNIADVLSLIRRSTKFKEWLATKDQSQDLTREYYNEITKGSFIDKLPAKSVRWAIFTGIGLAAAGVATGGVGVAAGMALGVLDTFFIDKLIKGWKPSQFIEEDIKKLIKK